MKVKTKSKYFFDYRMSAKVRKSVKVLLFIYLFGLFFAQTVRFESDQKKEVVLLRALGQRGGDCAVRRRRRKGENCWSKQNS